MENEVREWIAAAGTLGAVVVALLIAGRSEWRERRQRPRLSLDFDPEPDSPSLDLVTIEHDGEQLRPNWHSYWVRIRIKNRQGRRSAKQVEILVTRFRPRDRVRHGRPPLDTRPLRWSNTEDAAGRPQTEATIPPGVSRHCDLLTLIAPPAVRDPAGADPPRDRRQVAEEVAARRMHAEAALQIDPEPSDGRHRFGSGEYEIELAVTALDVDATFYNAVISFEGKWLPDSMWAALRVDPFTEGRLA